MAKKSLKELREAGIAVPVIPGMTLSDLRKLPGASNVGKYSVKEIFCGTMYGTFPITKDGKLDVGRVRNALARAHFDPNPDKVRACVLRHARHLLKKYQKKEKEKKK